MAPMTRTNANDDLIPTKEMAGYYGRRASAGLIITEGTIIRPDGLGYHRVPALFTEAQIHGWQHVTNEVHQNHGLIFTQIWHVGRVSHPHFLDGNLPISPSATIMTSPIRRTGLNYGKSRAASLAEIQELIASYANAATNAIKAGFDGVEIHGANGYLVDQFLHHHTNHREDDYGGSSENMARFALAIIKACGDAIGYERLGLRLSPGGYLNEIVGDHRDALVFQYLLEQLNQLPIAYVHTGNFDDSKLFPELKNQTMTAFIRSHYKGTVIACGGYTLEKAQQEISRGNFDLIAIGRLFIANPDLIVKLQKNVALRAYEIGMLDSLY